MTECTTIARLILIASFVAMAVLIGTEAKAEEFFADGDQIIREGYGEIDPTQLRERAEAGDPEAQTVLGVLYTTGATNYGIAQDFTEGIRWYRLAADQGEVTAQYNLGLSYQEGTGVEQNLATAFDWFERAADQGDPKAQYETGLAYFTGEGTKQNYKRARKWYERAAKQGHAGAQHNLGLIYLEGIGTSRRDILGLAWMYVAATQTDTPSGRLAQAFVENFEATMAKLAELGMDDSVLVWGREKAEELASQIEAER